MEDKEIEKRVLAYQLAKTITHEELQKVAGGQNAMKGYETTVLTFPFGVDTKWDA